MGQMFQAVIAPCDVYCPNAISRMNIGMAPMITHKKYGIRKAPTTMEKYNIISRSFDSMSPPQNNGQFDVIQATFVEIKGRVNRKMTFRLSFHFL